MATLPYSQSASPMPGTPRQPTVSANVRADRLVGEPRTDFGPLAQKYRTEILQELTSPLNKLMQLKKELVTSGGDAKLFDTYKFVVDNMRKAFKEGNSEGFDYLNVGGRKRRKTRRSK